MDRRQFLSGTAALAGAALAKPALAQTTEVSFFYPIAVGGPITKIIDGYAADFEKANPSIKVKPIYSGTYQESITKALTAHKSGTPPVTSVLLSTDMFTLIDEEAIVPIDGFIKTDDDKKWMASFFPAFMENSRTGGKTWGVPFQRSTIVLYWNKELFKEGARFRQVIYHSHSVTEVLDRIEEYFETVAAGRTYVGEGGADEPEEAPTLDSCEAAAVEA